MKPNLSFFFPLPTTPMPSPIPLKALTSQGRRFDVACRMVRSALLAGGKQGDNEVTCWFGGDSGDVIQLSFKPGAIHHRDIEAGLASELALAAMIGNAWNAAGRGAAHPAIHFSRDGAPGGFARVVASAIGDFKARPGYATVLLHEGGRRAIRVDRDGCCIDLNRFSKCSHVAFIVGSHDGYDDELEPILRNACDDEICLATDNVDVVSYLGSHVVAYLLALTGRCS